ncbi:MAG TPA: DUF2490 domain-containing protein [Draconibacterium sp.]|nr:DUF2490 domain-containing protein [Draconibacterium sp.]
MKRIILLFFIVCAAFIAQGKTKKFGTWVELEFSKSFLKDFEFSVVPEVRFQDDYSVDEYMVDGVLSWEPLKFLKLSAAYRINTNIRKKTDETTHRFAFDAQVKKEVGRVEASLRTRFTNYTEQAIDDPGNFFRPRLKLEYDIKGNKIRPFTSYELFRNTTAKEFQKARFDIGFTRKLGKIHRIGLYYRLQDYFSDRNSIHILGIEYRLKI